MDTEPAVNPERLKAARKAAGLNQEELGTRVGITQSHVSSMEGGRRSPSIELLKAMAQTLGVTVNRLCGGLAPTDAGPGRLTREAVLDDPESPSGLVALASDKALAGALDVRPDEWWMLRSLAPPGSLGKQGYLSVLLAVRANLDQSHM